MTKRLTWLLPGAALLAGIAGITTYFSSLDTLVAPTTAPTLQHAIAFNPVKPLATFTLPATRTTALSSESVIGRWSLIFLGYTSCPDVCPTTLAKLAALQPQLQQTTQQPVDIWLVSVDPKRDTLDSLKRYIQHFNAPLHAARAEHPELYPFVRSLGLMYAINEADTSGFYLVDHSASIALINPQGQLSAQFKPQFTPGSIPSIDSQALLTDFISLTSGTK